MLKEMPATPYHLHACFIPLIKEQTIIDSSVSKADVYFTANISYTEARYMSSGTNFPVKMTSLNTIPESDLAIPTSKKKSFPHIPPIHSQEVQS